MSDKPSSLPQTRHKRAKTVKVSVMLPRDVHRRVSMVAKNERRLLSPAIVVLVERGLAAVEAAA